MISVPSYLKVGQHFYNKDAPEDIGIYRVRTFEDGTKTPLYVDSVESVEQAVRKCRELDLESIDSKVDQ